MTKFATSYVVPKFLNVLQDWFVEGLSWASELHTDFPRTTSHFVKLRSQFPNSPNVQDCHTMIRIYSLHFFCAHVLFSPVFFDHHYPAGVYSDINLLQTAITNEIEPGRIDGVRRRF